jgi:hypothetical protein
MGAGMGWAKDATSPARWMMRTTRSKRDDVDFEKEASGHDTDETANIGTCCVR